MLRPKVHEDGLIVLSTRAPKGMKVNYNAEVFPILTYKDPLFHMWIKQVHDEDHSGITKTVAKNRRKFWIIKTRRIAERVWKSCYERRHLDKRLALQQMSPLLIAV